MNEFRWKEISVALFTIASAVIANLDLLALDPEVKKLVTFICLIILAFNHSVLSAKVDVTR